MGGGAGVGAAAGSMGEAGWVVAELAEHPGAEDETEPGQAVEDLGVRVLVKRRGQRVFQLFD